MEEFRAAVRNHWKQAGRSFPWRETRDPWLVMVSEFMLQQTQTERVVPYWRRWAELWPTPAALASAPLEDVLREWSGLGYNRRARYLRDAARAIVERFGASVPRAPEDLETLSGVGPYTARAISTFAYGLPNLFLETNIRAAALHFFFPGATEVRDRDILPLLDQAMDRDDPRTWYWALMDYGAALKKLVANPGRRSAHYVRQSSFRGSLRQARGAVLKVLSSGGEADEEALSAATGIEYDRIHRAAAALLSEGFLRERHGVYSIAR